MHGWSWSESIWNERLGSCLKLAFGNVTISEGFRWTPSNYKSNLLSLFRNLTQEHLHITPFMGYSDFALIGNKHVSIIQHVMMGEAEITDCIEVGIQASPAIDVQLSRGGHATVPKKLGELLANMYLYASLHHLNNSFTCLSAINWTTYGILIIRNLGFIGVQMTLSDEKCRVNQDCRMKYLERYLTAVVAKLN